MSDDLRTEDDIARLFADANPIPNHGRADGRWRHDADTTNISNITNSETRRQVMVGLEESTEPVIVQGHDRRRWLLAAAAVALVVSLAVAVIGRDDRESVTTATPITTPDTLPPTRLAVVEDFIAALSAHDVEAVSRTLAPGAVPAIAEGLFFSAEGTASVDDQLAWLEAFEWTSEIESCREQGDTGAYCTVRQRNRLSDLVPLEMSSRMLFGFRDGLIDQVVVSTNLVEYGREAYRPFIQWVEDHHPDDVERLWASVSSRAIVPIMTPAATELIDARLTEYIATRADAAAAAEADVALAGAFIRAFNDRDVPALSALVADPQAFFVEFADASDPATHFAWLDAFDWRWEEPECDVEVDVVVCRVRVRNKLTDASGVERWDVIRFSTADGRVEDMTEVNDDGEYWARALGPFVEWVAATHPEDLRAMWTFGSGIAPNLNEATIPLFAAHLDEWSSSDPLPTPAHRAFLAAQAGGDVETMSGLLAPDVVVDQLWASSVEELPHLSRLLTGLAWDWNIQSCSISARHRIACVADPTWRLDGGDMGVSPMIVEFELTRAGIASVSTGPWLERSGPVLAPLFEWMRDAHTEAAASLLTERGGTTVPVLSDAAVEQLLDLVDEFLASTGG